MVAPFLGWAKSLLFECSELNFALSARAVFKALNPQWRDVDEGGFSEGFLRDDPSGRGGLHQAVARETAGV
jgi:hypothetical protein